MLCLEYSSTNTQKDYFPEVATKMIISHKLKCIYIKSKKVAGTSFEIALSKYCGPDDVITYLSPEEEDMRISLGGYASQNDKYFDHEGYEFRYEPHTSSKRIKNDVPPEVWDNYLKIATIRCPYDALISRYYFRRRQPNRAKIVTIMKSLFPFKPPKAGFAHSISFRPHCRNVACFKTIHVDGKIVTDFLIRYEHLEEDIKKLEAKINCPGLLDTFQNVKAKGNFRPKGTAPYEMYSIYPEAKSIIDEILYDQQNQYEFLRKYWPAYKSKLEEAITRHQKSTASN